MNPVEFNVTQGLDYKISELPSPSKPSLQIDFLELVNRSTSIRSTLSTNDDYSVRTEDDASKTILGSDDFVFKASKQFNVSKDNTSSLKTLQEIATKRKYTRRNKEKEDKVVDDSVLKKRKLSPRVVAKEQKVVIKEQVNQIKDASTSGLRDSFPVPQVIIKNGVALIEKPRIQEEKEILNIEHIEIIEANPMKVTTSSSFKKTRHTDKWTKQETKKFYRALELFGTDFSMIAKLFQNRNRNQIKNKFLKEEKASADKINAAFSKTKSINFVQLLKRFKTKTSSNTALTNNTTENQLIRSQRSGSFNSTASLDSVDMSIMDDLADVFIPCATRQGNKALTNTTVMNVDSISLKIEPQQE